MKNNTINITTYSEKLESYKTSCKALLKLVDAHPGTGSVSMVAIYLTGSKPLRGNK